MILNLFLSALNRSTVTGQFSAITFLGNSSYHVTVFIPELVLIKPAVSEVGGLGFGVVTLGVYVFNFLSCIYIHVRII